MSTLQANPKGPNRFHFNFRWFWDYAGGLMTDWGVHMLNIVFWSLGQQAPKTITSTGGKDARPAHVRNFLDCVKSRQQPATNLDVGHFVTSIAHLGNIAYRTGEKITWDPIHERIPNSRKADALVGTEYRKPWKLPYTRRG